MTTAVNPMPIHAIPVTVSDGSGAGVFTPLGYQQVTLTATLATTLTVATGATTAKISVSTQPVRYRDDGVAPSSTSGFPLPIGHIFVYSVQPLAVQFIAQTAGAVLDILYYK